MIFKPRYFVEMPLRFNKLAWIVFVAGCYPLVHHRDKLHFLYGWLKHFPNRHKLIRHYLILTLPYLLKAAIFLIDLFG